MKILIVLALATLALGINIDPIKYLKDYGYLPNNSGHERARSVDGLGIAITQFQKFAHLPQTGILDKATLEMMQKPRCGVKDVITGNSNEDVRRKRFVGSTRYWEDRLVTYTFENFNIDLGPATTRRVIARAFSTWSEVTNLGFQEISGPDAKNAIIKIKFATREHGCSNAFDGRGEVLAHAFYPPNGKVHFDEDEEFTDREARGKNLFWVATHEIGHALGLYHSDVNTSVMYPYYQPYDPNFRLSADDIGSIQTLYGCQNHNLRPVPIPQDSGPYNGLLMERWLNVNGGRMYRIESNVCIYPHQPDSARILKKFEAPSNNGDSFATRIRGYFVGSKSIYHRFYLCADHSAKLYLSTSRDPQDKQPIITVKSPTSKDFSRCQASDVRYLVPGLHYYIEAIHKDGIGDDFLKVGVKYGEKGKISSIESQRVRWALTDTAISQIVCKGRYETLTCPRSTQIEITKASYGISFGDSFMMEKVKRICNYEGSGNSVNKCSATSSLRVVRAACQGKQQCTLYAHDTVFNDHCGKLIYSVLSVTYKCVTKAI